MPPKKKKENNLSKVNLKDVGVYINGDLKIENGDFVGRDSKSTNSRNGIPSDVSRKNEDVSRDAPNKIIPQKDAKFFKIDDYEDVLPQLDLSYGRYYIQREKLEKDLFEKFFSPKRLCLLYGLMGNGKTTLLKKILGMEELSKTNIYYIDLDNERISSLDDIFFQIFETIENFSSYQLMASSGVNFKSTFIKFITVKNVYLIIDNFDNELCFEFLYLVSKLKINTKIILLSSMSRHHFIEKLIRRNVDLDEICDFINIPEFTSDQAASLVEIKLFDRSVPEDYVLECVNKLIKEKEILNPQKLTLYLSYVISEIDESEGAIVQYPELEFMDSINDENSALTRIWNEKLSEEAKKLLCIFSFHSRGFNAAKVLKGIEDNIISTISELEALCLITRSSRPNIFISNTSIRLFIQNLENNKKGQKNIEEARNLWVNSCRKMITYLEGMWRDTSRVKLVDSLGGYSFVYDTLIWCYENNRYQDALEISKGYSYYFYVRGFWAKLESSVEYIRAESAKKLGLVEAEFEALIYLLNVLSKQKNTSDADFILERINTFDTSSFSSDLMVKFEQSKALLYYAKKDYKNAYKIWNGMYLNYSNLSNHYKSVIPRWLVECMIKMENPQYEKINSIVTESLSYAVQIKSLRDESHCKLKIFEVKIKNQNLTEQDIKDFLELEKVFVDVNDISFLGQYYFLLFEARVKLGHNENDAKVALAKSRECYEALFNLEAIREIDNVLQENYPS